MKITDVLDEQSLIADLKSKTKREVIAEMVTLLEKNGKIANADEIIDTLMEREELGSTGIGFGIAIPHGKTDQVGGLLAAFARSKAGVEFESLDGAKACLVFLLITPKDNASGPHLKALARISSLLKDKLFRQQIINAKDEADIYAIIKKEDERRG